MTVRPSSKVGRTDTERAGFNVPEGWERRV
jgi:hypothetical protein